MLHIHTIPIHYKIHSVFSIIYQEKLDLENTD